MHIFIHENVNLLEYALLLLSGPVSLGRCRMLSFVFQNFLGHGMFPDVVEYTSLLLRGPDAIERIQLLNYIYYIYRNVDVLQYPLLLLRGPDTPQRIQMLEFVCENAIRQRTMVAENTAAAVATDDEPGNPIDRLANVEGRPEIENRNCHDDNGAIKQEPTGAPGNANNEVANAEVEAEDGNEDHLIKQEPIDDPDGICAPQPAIEDSNNGIANAEAEDGKKDPLMIKQEPIDDPDGICTPQPAIQANGMI
jgi:hypothetical protein